MNADSSAPRLVLDTHVVLDWFYFGDCRASALGGIICSGRGRWMASPPMEDELRHVLARDVGGRGQGAIDATIAGFERWAERADPQSPQIPPGLRCTDPDDQKFLDLACRLAPAVLISADRAVLRLARRAAREGITILRLDDWTHRGVLAG